MRLCSTLLHHQGYQHLGGDQMQTHFSTPHCVSGDKIRTLHEHEISCSEEFEICTDPSNIIHVSIYVMLIYEICGLKGIVRVWSLCFLSVVK